MPEEVWVEAPTETGICILCGRCRPDCLNSTQGWLCRECWRKVAEADDPMPNCGRLAIIPNSKQYGYIVIDPANVILTVHGVLYFFRCENHAEEFRKRVLPKEPGTRVVRVQAMIPFMFVWGKPDLKMIFVKDVQESPKSSEGKT